MSTITLSKPTQEALARALKDRLASEFEVDIGQFEAVSFLDFLAEAIGPHFYNQGVQDASKMFREKFEDIAEAAYEIEKPITVR